MKKIPKKTTQKIKWIINKPRLKKGQIVILFNYSKGEFINHRISKIQRIIRDIRTINFRAISRLQEPISFNKYEYSWDGLFIEGNEIDAIKQLNDQYKENRYYKELALKNQEAATAFYSIKRML